MLDPSAWPPELAARVANIIAQFRLNKCLVKQRKRLEATRARRRPALAAGVDFIKVQARSRKRASELIGMLPDGEVRKVLGKLVSHIDAVRQWLANNRLPPGAPPSPEALLVRDALRPYDEIVGDDDGYAPFVRQIARQAGASVLDSNIRSERKRMRRVAISPTK